MKKSGLLEKILVLFPILKTFPNFHLTENVILAHVYCVQFSVTKVNLFFIALFGSLSTSGCGQEGFCRWAFEPSFLEKLYGTWVTDTTDTGCSEDSSKGFVTFENCITLECRYRGANGSYCSPNLWMEKICGNDQFHVKLWLAQHLQHAG